MKKSLSRGIKGLFGKLGYNISRIDPALQKTSYYTIYKYLKKDGVFDYEAYKQVQIDGNKRKTDQVWAIEENIVFLSRYIQRIIGDPSFGICHGTRQGLEQKWFKEQLRCNIIGTEISDTATQFPDTIQWDFHDVKPEWINAADFIYSNAFDHSYDPEKCLNAWMSCLKTGELCILEHSSGHSDSAVTQLDPFGADIAMMPYLILTWGKGVYGVREIIDAPQKPESVTYLSFIIIQNW